MLVLDFNKEGKGKWLTFKARPQWPWEELHFSVFLGWHQYVTQVPWNGAIFMWYVADKNMFHLKGFLQARSLPVKKAMHQKAIQIINFTSFSTFKRLWSTIRFKAKTLHIYPFMANVTWVKWLKDPSVQRRWKTLIQRERKDETGKNVDVLNLTRNSRLCSRHFKKERISTDGYMSGDPVYFAWNNQRKPQVWGRQERHGSVWAVPSNMSSFAVLGEPLSLKIVVNWSRLKQVTGMSHNPQKSVNFWEKNSLK